jgi:hypothetical protein
MLMVAQAFVDESGNKGQARHFVMAALVGSSEVWAEFSDEWKLCLRETPAIAYFKMKEAAGKPSGQFRGLSTDQRDGKLRDLARIINRYPKLMTYSTIDLEAFAKVWGRHEKPQNDPYFWPYQNTIMTICHELWDRGWRERFEINYDENVISGLRARPWYPFIRTMMATKYSEQTSILPVDPMFKSDDEFMPLQACDLFAWCIRDATDKQQHGDDHKFGWLIKELSNVQVSDYSQYYDFDRLSSIVKESERMVRDKEVPDGIIEAYRKTRASTRKR